jgi:hypothetical protein
MFIGRQEMSYHGSQSTAYRKTYRLENALRASDIMGPYSLLDTTEPRAPFGGAPEVDHRTSLQGLHPGGTVEVMKIIIARRIGISRTRERAAPQLLPKDAVMTSSATNQGS